jgi:hypothetical protein
MVTGRDCIVQREYYREQVRMAEQDRVARMAMAGERLSPRFRKVLSRLGARLVAWGTQLQEQYEAVVATSPAHPAVGR